MKMYKVYSDGENYVVNLEMMQRVRKSDYISNNETCASYQAGSEAEKRVKLVLEALETRFAEPNPKVFIQRKSIPHKPKHAADWQEEIRYTYTFADHTVVFKKGRIFLAKGEESKTEIWIDGKYEGFVQVYRQNKTDEEVDSRIFPSPI